MRVGKFLLSVALLFTWVSPAFAQESTSYLGDIRQPLQASEFIFRSAPKESLISVQLLGAVAKPGIYYVPMHTDLLKLLTLAGGSTSSGDISEILVRKTQPKTWSLLNSKAISEYEGAFEVDAEKIIKYGGGSQLRLQQDDFVYVPVRSSIVSGDNYRAITVISVLAGIILTGLLIEKNSK